MSSDRPAFSFSQTQSGSGQEHCRIRHELEVTREPVQFWGSPGGETRFVCSLRHEAIQRRLLSEVDLTYAKAIEIASGMEAADRDTRSFKASDTVLRKLHTHSGVGKKTQPCFRCNRSGHNAGTCTFREVTCTHVGSKATLRLPAARRTKQHQSHQGKAVQ